MSGDTHKHRPKQKHQSLSELPGQVDDDVASRLQGGARGRADNQIDLGALAIQGLDGTNEPSASHQTGASGSDVRADSKSSLDDGDHGRSSRANSASSVDVNPPSNASILARHDSGGDGPGASGEVKARASSLAERPVAHDDPGDAGDVKPRSQSLPVTATFTIDGAENGKSAAQAPAQSLSGDIKNEIGKLPATFLKQAASGALAIQVAAQQEIAKSAGTYSSSGSLGLGEDDKPKAVKTTDGTTQKEVTNGTYGGGYAGTLTYRGDAGAGVVVAAGYEEGWTSRTIVKEDRFGAEVVVTESWADATLAVGARGEAHANTSGAELKVKVKAEIGYDSGVRVSVTDVKTGITYTKMGHLSAGLHAEGEAKVQVTWERVSLSLSAASGVSAAAAGTLSIESKAGNGAGITGEVKASLEALAKAGVDASWNPADGYGVKVSNGVGVDFGVALGLSPSLKNSVSALTVGADAVLGRVGAHADIDFGYKDGKISAKFDVGGALGIGYNVKFGVDIDGVKWAKNIQYTEKIFYPNAGTSNGDLNRSNPGAAFAHVIWSMFDSAPEPEAPKKVLPSYWTPPTAAYDSVAKEILWGGGHMAPGTLTNTEVMKFFSDALVKYAKVDELKSAVDHTSKFFYNSSFSADLGDGKKVEFKNAEDYATKLKAQYKFLDRDPTDAGSFSFTDGKSPIQDLSDRCAKWFPASQDPSIKAMELTFNKLPDGFEKTFKLVTDAKGDQSPDTTSAFAIFGQVSLVQYLSVKAFDAISSMDAPTRDAYLSSRACDYLTDEAKIKLKQIWGDAFAAGALGNPYKASLEGSTSLSVADKSFEAKFWDLQKSTDDSGVKKAKFDALYADFTSSLKTSVTDPAGLDPVRDDTKIEKHPLLKDFSLVQFKSIPMDPETGGLIDISEAKAGKIGLHDLIYDYTTKKMDTLQSPQAVYQFLTSPRSDWIADGDGARYMLVNEWWDRHGNGEWRTGQDPDAIRSQEWYAAHVNDLFNRASYR